MTTSGGSTVGDLEAEVTNSTSTAATVQTLTFTYDGAVADATNPDVTLTNNKNGTYTLTPTAGYNGVQYLEVAAITPVSGTFQLEVGSITTAAINFDSTNLTTTAANMQSALVTAGFSGATVSVVSDTTAAGLQLRRDVHQQ